MRVSRRQKSSLLFSPSFAPNCVIKSCYLYDCASFNFFFVSRISKKLNFILCLETFIVVCTIKTEIDEIEGKSFHTTQQHDSCWVLVGNFTRHSLGVHYQIVYFIVSPDNSRNSAPFDSSIFYLPRKNLWTFCLHSPKTTLSFLMYNHMYYCL
jgi:hypothetical protein